MQTKYMHGYAKEGIDEFFLFKKFLFFFKRFVPSAVSTTNWHLLVLNGHGSHVTLEVV